VLTVLLEGAATESLSSEEKNGSEAFKKKMSTDSELRDHAWFADEASDIVSDGLTAVPQNV
jgi:hypothetical protein